MLLLIWIASTYKNASWEGRQFKLPLGTTVIPCQSAGFGPLVLHFQSSFPLGMWEASWRTTQVLQSRPPIGRPGWNSWHLAWSGPTWLLLPFGEGTDGRISLSLSLSLSHSITLTFKWIDSYFFLKCPILIPHFISKVSQYLRFHIYFDELDKGEIFLLNFTCSL